MTVVVTNPRAHALQGQAAGFVSRVLADVIDIVIVVAVYAAGLCGVALVRFLVTSAQLRLPRPDEWGSGLAVGLLLVLYFTYGWTTTGQTVGKRVAGLRVLRVGGGLLHPARALVRAVVAVVLPLFTLLWIAFSRRSAGLDDVLAGSTVVYDWSA